MCIKSSTSGTTYRFKNQNPARGRKPSARGYVSRKGTDLRTRTPQGDGNCDEKPSGRGGDFLHLRTRTPQGDGNFFLVPALSHLLTVNLRTRTPQGDGNPSAFDASVIVSPDLRTRTPQGDGNYECEGNYYWEDVKI